MGCVGETNTRSKREKNEETIKKKARKGQLWRWMRGDDGGAFGRRGRNKGTEGNPIEVMLTDTAWMEKTERWIDERLHFLFFFVFWSYFPKRLP